MPSRKVASSRSLYDGVDPISTLDSTAKVKLLEKVEQLARSRDPRIAQVMAGLASEYDVVLIARADGTLAAQDFGWRMRHSVEDMVRSAWDAHRRLGISASGDE